jgi:hypothetical protein
MTENTLEMILKVLTRKLINGWASPEDGANMGPERSQFRVVSALLSDQYFLFSRPDFTGRKGLVRGVQKWGGNQVPSNTLGEIRFSWKSLTRKRAQKTG